MECEITSFPMRGIAAVDEAVYSKESPGKITF
jgi:hypothetical protein